MDKKRQIKLTESEIKEMVRNTIKEHFGLDSAIKKGVWSSDDPEAAADMKKSEDVDNQYRDWYGGTRDNFFSDMMFKRANGEDSELPRRKGYGMGRDTRAEDERMRELYRDEEEEGKRYDENPEGTENIWDDEYEPEEIEEPYEMYEGKQIKLNESQLREFISYSVARILKEGYGREIILHNGESDGFEGSPYGYDSFVIEPDLDKYLDELDPNDIDAGDTFLRAVEQYLGHPVKVKVEYYGEEGMKGDQYLQPDDSDSYRVTDWQIVDGEKIKDPQLKAQLEDMVSSYMGNDFDIYDMV